MTSLSQFVLLSLALFSILHFGAAQKSVESDLRIGSWNIQIFGLSKLADQAAIDIILKVLSRYDLIAIQEIRDSSGTVLPDVIKQLNKHMENIGSNVRYKFLVSERLGRSHSKEQYAFIYNAQLFSPIATYQAPSSANYDFYERPPFSALFKIEKSELKQLAVMNIHTSPSDAVKEIGHLTTTLEDIKKIWKSPPTLITGDFNADCSYARSSILDNLEIRSKEFTWLIDDLQDTTVSDTDCSYDRFVTDSKELVNTVVDGSPKVYRFDEKLGYSLAVSKTVSDHYPIELLLAGKINKDLMEGYQSILSFSVENHKVTASKPELYKAFQEKNAPPGYTLMRTYKKSGGYLTLNLKKYVSQNLLEEIYKISQKLPEIVTPITADIARNNLLGSIFQNPQIVRGFNVKKDTFLSGSIQVTCFMVDPYICKLTVSFQLPKF